MTRPLRPVQSSKLRSARGSVIGPDTNRRIRYWELELDCGHNVERSVKYKPRTSKHRANGWHPRKEADVLPAPARARCDYCVAASTPV